MRRSCYKNISLYVFLLGASFTNISPLNANSYLNFSAELASANFEKIKTCSEPMLRGVNEALKADNWLIVRNTDMPATNAKGINFFPTFAVHFHSTQCDFIGHTSGNAEQSRTILNNARIPKSALLGVELIPLLLIVDGKNAAFMDRIDSWEIIFLHD